MKLTITALTLAMFMTLPATAQDKGVRTTATATSSSSSSSASATAGSELSFKWQERSDENIYKRARNLFFRRQYAEATALYESLLKHFPESSRASQSIYYMGLCYEKLGNTDKAFECYKKAVFDYQDTIAGKTSLQRAAAMARTMRRFKGDEYDKFLVGILNSDKFSDDKKRYTAAVMASAGDWQGLERLLESMEKGSDIEQIRVSELLAKKSDDPRVKKMFQKALKNSDNVIVRANALYALRGTLTNGDGKKVYIAAMLDDPYFANRARAFGMLTPYYKDKEVEEGFNLALSQEKDPNNLNNFAMFYRTRYEDDKLAAIASERLKNEQNPVNKMMLTGMLGRKSNFGSMDIRTVTNLLNSPNPEVRISAVRVLEDKASNPDVRYLLVNKLKNDPSEQVRLGALNALSSEVVDDDIRAVVIDTIKTSDDTALVTTSIQVIRGQIHIKGVREQLVKTMGSKSQPIVTYQIVRTLSPEVNSREVATGFLQLLQDPKPHLDVKLAITSAFEHAEKIDPEIQPKIRDLYFAEENSALADGYFRIIKRANPEKAEELKQAKMERLIKRQKTKDDYFPRKK